MSIGKRYGKIGMFATLILMFSIVLFLGSLFWLIANGPWNSGSNLFHPASNEDKKDTPDITLINITIEDAIQDLEDSGCICLNYEKEIELNNVVKLEYSKFKDEAIKTGIVLIVSNEESKPRLLFIQSDDLKAYWSP